MFKVTLKSALSATEKFSAEEITRMVIRKGIARVRKTGPCGQEAMITQHGIVEYLGEKSSIEIRTTAKAVECTISLNNGDVRRLIYTILGLSVWGDKISPESPVEYDGKHYTLGSFLVQDPAKLSSAFLRRRCGVQQQRTHKRTYKGRRYA